jgi:hypothetical protein
MNKNKSLFSSYFILIVICVFALTPLFISCGSSSSNGEGGEVSDLCLSENCTDAQLDNNFERAIKELEEEGLVINLETVSTDPAVYYAIANRIRSIAGVEGAVQQVQLAGVIIMNDPFEHFDNSVEYCGPDKSSPGGGYTTLHPGQCLNRACWAHDDCYDTIRIENSWCA